MSVIHSALSPVERQQLEGAWARIEQIHQTSAADSKRLNDAADRFNFAADRFDLVAAATLEAIGIAKSADDKAERALEAVERVEAESDDARGQLQAQITETRAIAESAAAAASTNAEQLSQRRVWRGLYFALGVVAGLMLGVLLGCQVPSVQTIEQMPELVRHP